MNEFIVKKQVTIEASPSKVWDALTDPAKTKKFFFNCEVISSWKVGSPITFKGKIFYIKKIEMTGEILKIEPGRFLQYTLKNGNSDSSISTVTDELISDNEKTILKISDDVGQGKGAEIKYKRSLKGWDKILMRLKELVENENHVSVLR